MRRGVTLLELLITIGIATVLGAITVSIYINQLRSQRQAFQRSDIEAATRLALSRVVKTIRDAQASSTGGYPLLAAGAQSITVFSNTDADSGIEQVRFFLSGTQLQRGIIQPTGSPATYPAGSEVVSTIAPNVQNGANPVFTYFAGDALTTSTPLTQPVTPTAVRLVRIQLTVDADTAQPPVASDAIVNVQLRNLKDNY